MSRAMTLWLWLCQELKPRQSDVTVWIDVSMNSKALSKQRNVHNKVSLSLSSWSQTNWQSLILFKKPTPRHPDRGHQHANLIHPSLGDQRDTLYEMTRVGSRWLDGRMDPLSVLANYIFHHFSFPAPRPRSMANHIFPRRPEWFSGQLVTNLSSCWLTSLRKARKNWFRFLPHLTTH